MQKELEWLEQLQNGSQELFLGLYFSIDALANTHVGASINLLYVYMLSVASGS